MSDRFSSRRDDSGWSSTPRHSTLVLEEVSQLRSRFFTSRLTVGGRRVKGPIMTEQSGVPGKLPGAREIEILTPMARANMRCAMAGYLVGEDDTAIYVADLQGTWVLPHGSYENLGDWEGGREPPEMLQATGRPVQLVLKEGAVIHELRPYTIRAGGDPIAARKNRSLIRKIFSADGALPEAEVSVPGAERLLALEEAFGRRLGWDPEKSVREQVFFEHHLQTASWDCGSDGGGG